MPKTFFRFLSRNWKILLFFSAWIVYFALFWSRAVYFDARGNFWAGHVNIWGDWAAHFTMAYAMEQRGLFISSPFLLGANFSYPFVADYISAILLSIGVPFIPAFTVPSFIFSVLIVVALYFFYKTIFVSKRVATLATTIFLCNGGIGFFYFIQDIIESPTPLATLLNPYHEYTRIDQLGIRWISVIDSMIIPQRSFALGFSCALLALAMVYRHFFAPLATYKFIKRKNLYLMVIGLLLGFLPILHTHSFLAAFVFMLWWMIIDLKFLAKGEAQLKHFKDWLVIGGVTSLIALPLLKIYFLSNTTNNFFHVQLGWMAKDFNINWIEFTWKNWGITPILAIIAWIFLYKRMKQKIIALLLLPSFLLFVLSNIFLFQPWSWDNTKLLVWFLLGSSGLISYFVVHFYQTKWKILALLLLIFVTASGAIDAYRIQKISLHSYQEYSSTEMMLSKWVIENTDKNSIWLSSQPHNHWLFNLTGRQTVLAYPGWLWTQGYDYRPTQDDVILMYKGDENALQLLAQYNVDYVVLGPIEKKELQTNSSFFSNHFPVAYQLGETTIYKVK